MRPSGMPVSSPAESLVEIRRLERRVHDARMDVAADAIPGELDGQRLGEEMGPLGRGVGVLGTGEPASADTDYIMMMEAAPARCRCGSRGHPEHRLGVDGHHAVPQRSSVPAPSGRGPQSTPAFCRARASKRHPSSIIRATSPSTDVAHHGGLTPPPRRAHSLLAASSSTSPTTRRPPSHKSTATACPIPSPCDPPPSPPPSPHPPTWLTRERRTPYRAGAGSYPPPAAAVVLPSGWGGLEGQAPSKW